MYKLISFILLTCICPVSLLYGAEEITPAKAPSVDPPTKNKPESKKAAKEKTPFMFVSESQVNKSSFGMAMVCPQHGGLVPNKKKLEVILQSTIYKTPTINCCRCEQIKTLRMFHSMVERIVVNPFIPGACVEDNNKAGLPWPNQEHPRINRLRLIKQICSDEQLLAILNVTGELREMVCTVEDIKWMVCAAIGSGFQGVVWRGDTQKTGMAAELGYYEDLIKDRIKFSSDAMLVDWVKPQVDVLASSVLSGDRLYVVLLNPKYLDYTISGTYHEPLGEDGKIVSIQLSPECGFKLHSATALKGIPVQLEGNSFDCVLSEGSEIVIISVLKTTQFKNSKSD